MHSGIVFITGGSGFVGRHVVRQLAEQGDKVRALVRRIPQRGYAASVEFVTGDLCKPETYASALRGASAVVHAALTDDLSHEPQATSALQNLSGEAGVRKFIHLSSIAIYGNPESGTITEETSPLASSDAYTRTKLAIEEALLAKSSLPETVILRLGCVYGPGGGWWSDGMLNQMERGNVILLNDGAGIANLIHVIDIVGLVSALLQRSNPPFDVFNVTDGMPVTWRNYFSELERILGRKGTVCMNAQEAREHARRWLRPSLLRRVTRKILCKHPIYPLDEGGIAMFTSQAIYSNKKAATMLAFKPRYDLQSGMSTIRSTASLIQEPLVTRN